MIYMNNRLVPDRKALISVFDHGFLYGDGIYETLRAYNGVIYKIDEHIDRLFRSARMIELGIAKSPAAVKKAVYKTLDANRLKEAVIRITVSRGAGPTGLDPDLCPKPTFVIFAYAFKQYPKHYYQRGIKIAIVHTRRNYKKAIDPQIKSLNFLNNILAKIEAKGKNAYEAVMMNYRGHIAEGTVTNIFFVRDSVLCTPSLHVGILDGITRGIILELAGELNVKTEEGIFTSQDVYNAQEVFIANTTMEIMPVAVVDHVIIGAGAGKLTRMIGRAYKRNVSNYV